MKEMLFETRGLVFHEFIRYPDLAMERGKVQFVVGESGSGKSTLLKLFNGVLSPSKGEILYKGRSTSAWETLALRREVSLVSQNVWLPGKTIAECFQKLYEARNQFVPEEERMCEMLRLCCLDMPPQKETAQLSGGERQRVYTALFLSFRPPVLLLDEPTAALDSQNAEELLRGVISFCKGYGGDVVVVSHDRGLEQQFSEQTTVLSRGEW